MGISYLFLNGKIKILLVATGSVGECMVRRMIASRIFVAGGLVCSNVSGLFVELCSWP
jgi:hypothetical protein